MKINKNILIVLVALFLGGCGDQWWCGDDGCNAASSKSMVRSTE
ncbi:hypothetical protein RO575_03470 [Methylomonas sp. MO1]|nr:MULTISPECIES: hypothetical protein [unclassified Methylomonas]MDT4288607.1 hypothetical protein [Methylomonas sp. MO1]